MYNFLPDSITGNTYIMFETTLYYYLKNKFSGDHSMYVTF